MSGNQNGWVVARCNSFGAWYILSNRVYATRLGANIHVVNNRCEVVVPWQGTQAATLAYRSEQDLQPSGRLP